MLCIFLALLCSLSMSTLASCMVCLQRSYSLRKFPQIYAVSMGVVLVIMRILCILFKSLLLSHSQPPSPHKNKDMEISCESAVCLSNALQLSYEFKSVRECVPFPCTVVKQNFRLPSVAILSIRQHNQHTNFVFINSFLFPFYRSMSTKVE